MIAEILKVLYHMIYTVISNTASTIVVVLKDLLLIFNIALTSSNSLLGVLVVGLILSIILIGIFSFGMSSAKTIFIGIAVLFILFLILLILR